MRSIYNAFLESDKKGFETLDSLKTPPNAGSILFEKTVIMAIVRKLSKPGLDFAFSPDSSISNLTFIKPKGIRESLVSVNISNQEIWRGKSDFSGIGNAFEPITFSELRHARKNNLPVFYV